MSDICPMQSCLFYCQGRCFLEETRNPGRDGSHTCRRLTWLLQRWDDFLDRADVFDLTEKEARRVWDTLFQKYMKKLPPCPEPDSRHGKYERAFIGAVPGCPCLIQTLCLLTMPCCSGKCSSFTGHPASERAWR